MTQFKFQKQLDTQLAAITGEAKAVEALLQVAKEAKPEDVGTYLLILEESLTKRLPKASVKVIKSNTKLVLEYGLGLKEGQSEWPEGAAIEQLEKLCNESGSLNNLAKAVRSDLKDATTGGEDKEDKEAAPVNIMATIENMVKALKSKGCDKAEIAKALTLAAKALG